MTYDDLIRTVADIAWRRISGRSLLAEVALMKVAILFDAGSDEWSPQDVAAVVANVHEVRDVLRRRGHEVELLPVRLGDFRWLSRARRADLVFNLCEGVNGHARFEDFVVGTLELDRGAVHRLPAPGRPRVCHRKHVANTLLSAAGLPVPAFVLAQGNKTAAEFPLPAIVKPSAEDASVGIDNGAVCTTQAGPQEAGRPDAASSGTRCWSRNTSPAGSSTSASSASECCRSPRSSSTGCPMAAGPS